MEARTDTFSWLTIADVAKRLNVSTEMVRQMCIRGQIKSLRIGRLYRISPAEMQRFESQAMPAPVKVQRRPAYSGFDYIGD